MDVILRAHQLVKSYGANRAVDGVDLNVRAGEAVALLGPNGAGKTTTLMMVLGVISPDSGWVEIGNRRLPSRRSEALQEVGFSAGYMPLAERLKVREFLRMYGRFYGLRNPDARINRGLERFHIGHLADAMSARLSSGQRTLIGIVKATLHQPRLLVLDEPTASLDPDVALRVRTGLLELSRDEGTALLITSHDMVEIARLCERVVFLSRGRVIANDAPDVVAAEFGRDDLEGVFLHLADVANGRSSMAPAPQETDRP
jgi:ABC-2 type transport system ATP-binding protein